MGKPTGFLEYDRSDNTVCAPSERINNFDEFKQQLNEEERRRQGARCMNCGVPFCQSAIRFNGRLIGCPLHNLIPEWNDEVYNGNYSHALDRLLKTNNFPEFTGRVCPALCERACINGKYDSPVTVHENELFIIEKAFEEGLVKARIPAIRSGKRVAVVGSGPAGLACADQLNHRGHSITVYEKSDRAGGLLMYGIPNMKLEKSVIERRIKLMEQEGVKFVCNTAVAQTPADDANASETAVISAAELMNKYDAVVLCCGAEVPRKFEAWEDIKTKQKDISGVYYAMDYLKAETKHLLDGIPEISAKGLNVVVVGAGDTANDCIATAVRQKAASVTQLIRRSEGGKPKLTWPDYDESEGLGYGQEEAISVYGKDIRVFETGVKNIVTDDKSKLKEIQTVGLKRKDGVYTEIAGSEQLIPADLLIVASGFSGCDEAVIKAFTGEKSEDEVFFERLRSEHKTKVQGLFIAGDMRIGASLVVRAIAEGRDCASQVDEYLVGYRVMERL